MNNEKILESKVIVISGGTKGVGRDLAIACANEGARVVINGRDEASAKSILQSILANGGEAQFVATDLNNPDSCESMFNTAFHSYGSVDGFVNYAGVTSIGTLLDTDLDTFNRVMDVNFRAAFFCCQHAVNYMKKSNGGSIILVGSCHASRGEKDRAAYACSKGALRTLCEHIAFHYGKDQVRCNTLTMGWSLTDGELALRKEQGVSAEEVKRIAQEAIPMGRMQESEDYIPGMMYLLSDASSMVSGSELRVSGGLYL